ncbi:zinc-binding protein A33-like isoform X2 [Narcine bancroftii]|uniref:zinc-binding protein A33-like isoform X2 n=1 Tax=Narcine bancroftii TaxID=1343680 RepID=UPI003831BEBE
MHYDSIELESKCQVDDEELHEKVSELAGLKKKSRETDEHLLRKVKDIESLKNDLLITGNEIMEKDLEIEKLRKSQKRPGPFGSRQGNLVSQPRARDHATRESTEGDQVTVLLDQYTADPRFTVSKNLTSICWDKALEGDPISRKKHSNTWTVWGAEGFAGGCKYWEVVVSPGTVWSVGLAKQHLATGRWNRLLPRDGYWTLMLWNIKSPGHGLRTLGSSIIIIQLNKVGVYLDYEEGRISFFNPDNSTHLYSYNDKFTNQLFPIFKLWVGSIEEAILTIW